jgi:hypothetical protein
MDEDDIIEIKDNIIYNIETIMLNNNMNDGDKHNFLLGLINNLTNIKNDLDV